MLRGDGFWMKKIRQFRLSRGCTKYQLQASASKFLLFADQCDQIFNSKVAQFPRSWRKE